jgi:hypothetical protein
MNEVKEYVLKIIRQIEKDARAPIGASNLILACKAASSLAIDGQLTADQYWLLRDNLEYQYGITRW